jgi:tryptophan-rich sensory protein
MAMVRERRRPWEIWLGLGLFLALVGATAWLGTQVTLPSLGWYATLAKPGFTPPDRVFGPVWTVLYVLMAVAAWRVWKAEANPSSSRRALAMFLAQLALNALWSPVFFGARRPDVAFVLIVMLLGALCVTLLQFFRVDRLAGWLLAPYLLWIAYAAVLNGAIVLLNRP